MSQKLFTKNGELRIERSWMGSGHRHLAELSSGAFVRIDGTPIQDVSEMTSVMSEPHLTRALAWWEHRDDEPGDEPERPVMFVRGVPCYADTMAPLASLNEVLSAFPEKGPFREAALTWWQQTSAVLYAAEQDALSAFSEETGMIPQELPITKKLPKQSRVEQLINS